MAELLLELLSEEIPARMQVRAANDLKRLMSEGLKKAGLEFSEAKSFVTPRRLTLVVDGLPEKQPDVREERKGPKVGAPEQAINGFLGSTGLTLDQCEIQEGKKGSFYVAVIEKKGQDTIAVLPEIIIAALNALPWAKSMKWGANSLRWVRPLQNILCIMNGAVVPFDFGPVTSCGYTRGHRFLAPNDFSVDDFASYATLLREHKVILDQEERKASIKEQAEKVAREQGYVLKDDEGLLNEVTGLVEWPVVHAGQIDDEFMAVPQECLITSMRSHQKYFSCLKEDGSLAPRFVVVANKVAPDGGKAIIAGNERVLRARLSDAKFFWDQDLKKNLEDLLPKLDDMLFHAKLGSMGQKVARMEKLSGELSEMIEGADLGTTCRAAHLAKADLVSEMVYEFPELQGIMGEYYAEHHGESPLVAQAIADHYAPQGPSDACPSAPNSVAVSLADKIDTLVGFWSIDEKPTGSKDPFALRRAALGVIRLILENNLRLNLLKVFSEAHTAFSTVNGLNSVPSNTAQNEQNLLDFFADRLKVHLKDEGIAHDMITAVFSKGGEDDLVRLLARVKALKEFLSSDDGANLVAAYRRAMNIVRIEEKKDGVKYNEAVEASLLEQDEEQKLFEKLEPVMGTLGSALKEERFAEAMAALATLRGPVDAFFDKVTVNCENADVRANRLRLLSQIGHALDGIADFSKLEG
ncbi:Glycine--tRNA ligase beta subunit [Candidatus Terasakiella magnetica]|uniref:Glycine--tRNA ligase beta subunit n=1 Tax=Candidatus Terasakiella magnetica TaxID=1867952 RepID=A0A1C3RHY0_9PROT|nr:glycine--tRNA ligase subunit beta [Candidatus Terasakiella magnetica]SCA56886.1 Glycine--tRNA ligase beta subunit [Candidatus Terasakiella magnetica]